MLRAILLIGIFCLHASMVIAESVTDEDIDQKIKFALSRYQTKFVELEDEVNRHFDINFGELRSEFETAMVQVRNKMALIEHIKEPHAREPKLRALQDEYADERLYQFIDAYYYFANELEKDHAFVGDFLSMLEEILEMVIERDPLFKYAFNSREFQSRYGLILKRVVWKPGILKNASAETIPINVHSVFADKARIPVLMKLTPAAFSSSAFLRSILIHELSHVYFYKLPKYSDVKKFEGVAKEPESDSFVHYFKQLNPREPTFQYHLIQEYYGFKAQLLYHNRAPLSRYHQLDEDNLKSTKSMLHWTYSELSKKNKAFVKANPEPPVSVLIYRFLRGNLK